MPDGTRVYTPAGTKAHVLPWYASPNNSAEKALCGRSAWPAYWHGTGSQDEYEKAADLPLCTACAARAKARES